MITKEPVSATHSFLSAGILLASTTLISSQAIAQTEAGGIAPLPVQDSQTERGDVYFKPKHCQAQLSETSSEASSMSEPSSVSSEPAASNITPDVVQSVGGVSVPEMRGEVTIPPKK